MLKQSATDALKTTSKRAIQKTAEATGDLTGNTIADKIIIVSKTSPKNNSETNEEKILREKYISAELRQKIIDDLRLKEENLWWLKIKRRKLKEENQYNIIMKYKKIINLLDNTPNQPTKFRTKVGLKWMMNHMERITLAFKLTSMLRARLCDCNDVYILFKGTVTVANAAAAGADTNNANKKVIFNNYAPFTSCINRINNTQIDDAQYNDVVMPMYNLIKYSDICSGTSGISFQYCRDIPAVDNDHAVPDLF